jgi:hypothetical protein
MANAAPSATADRAVQIRFDLLNLEPEVFASKWLLERVPFIFGDDADGFRNWRHALCRLLGVDAACLLVVGSAGVGVSLSPTKLLRPFGRTSDVDLAVVSTYHFDVVWRWLRNLGAERYRYPADVQYSITDHRTRLVYWGVAATDKLLAYTPLGSEWVPALATVTREGYTADRDVKIRLYRDFEALRAYNTNTLRELARQLTEEA